MAQEKPNGPEHSLAQHVRKVLTRISALQTRLRAQAQAGRSGLNNAVEVERDGDSPGGIHTAHPPA